MGYCIFYAMFPGAKSNIPRGSGDLLFQACLTWVLKQREFNISSLPLRYKAKRRTGIRSAATKKHI